MPVIDTQNTRTETVPAGTKKYYTFNGMYSQLIVEIAFTGVGEATVYDSISSFEILDAIKQGTALRSTASWRTWTNGTITDGSAPADKVDVANCPNGIEVDNSGGTDLVVNIRLNR